ncbi:alpha/beta hydrolase [Qipengyuania sp. 1NDH17]|uniref:Alpha/beta hydrolase n=1 Tax=Qipengyuania polymorpha TaxID=2867234 RepID=A0ABS7J3L5_9SPHN|nr:alpha/beta hydrolase [Qipengyuania polymorpha]MBX7458664.1 alpha/beta hydrolase [Qipengyuania polymorpha]
MKRRVMWTLGIILALLALAGLALWIGLQRNAPAVLDTIDSIAGPSHDVSRVHEERFGEDPLQQLIVYREEGASGPLPVFIFFHGGAWAHGNPQDYGFIARNIAPQGYVVVLGGYRLNGSGRYPAMLRDTASVIGWVHENIADHGGDPGRIFLSGHSAGAYNVAQVALDGQWLEEAGVPDDIIRGVVGLAGPYDFYPFDTDRSRAAFESVGAGEESQPVNHATAAAPPMLLVHGEADTTVRIRNSRALEKALRATGAMVETLYLPGKTHNDPLLALTSPWRRNPQVFERVTNFMAAQVSVPVQPQTP